MMMRTNRSLLFSSRDAVFSSDRIFRYRLTRRWSGDRLSGRIISWVMLNPSTADEFRNDPTIRRCIGFSKKFGYTGLEIVNLFAYRSPNPSSLMTLFDPVGPENNAHIVAAASDAELVVCAWGGSVPPRHQARPHEVISLLSCRGIDLWCLGQTAHGHPAHPLYLKQTTPLVRFIAP
jgi:hypothetical protein